MLGMKSLHLCRRLPATRRTLLRTARSAFFQSTAFSWFFHKMDVERETADASTSFNELSTLGTGEVETGEANASIAISAVAEL